MTVVGPGAMTLTAPATIALAQTANLTLTLTSPAPAGGLTVEFASSDSGKVGLSQTSINIPAGATAPTVAPQVVGVNVGSAAISVSANGYAAPAPVVVNVNAAVTWVTPSATIVGNGNSTPLIRA